MKIQVRAVALGFGLACLLFVGTIAAFAAYFLYADSVVQPIYREQMLRSGTTVKVTSFNIYWGVEHKDRRTRDDGFGMEYVSSITHEDLGALDREASEVFELIRAVSEQWGFGTATISAFPTTKRKGPYYIYTFARQPRGDWTFERKSAKVFIND